MLTFRMYMGRAHSGLLASLSHPLPVRSCSHSGEPLYGSEDISRIQIWLPYRNWLMKLSTWESMWASFGTSLAFSPARGLCA